MVQVSSSSTTQPETKSSTALRGPTPGGTICLPRRAGAISIRLAKRSPHSIRAHTAHWPFLLRRTSGVSSSTALPALRCGDPGCRPTGLYRGCQPDPAVHSCPAQLETVIVEHLAPLRSQDDQALTLRGSSKGQRKPTPSFAALRRYRVGRAGCSAAGCLASIFTIRRGDARCRAASPTRCTI